MSGPTPRTPPEVGPAAPDRGPDGEKRWIRSAQVAGIIGTVLAVASLAVGLLAWQSPVAPPSPSAPNTSPPATSRPTGDGGTGSAPGPAAGRYLTDLRPDTGGGNVQRTGAHSLLMKCATGESDDRYREVSYLVPQVGYRSFTSTAAATGERETRVQVLLLIDDRVVADPVFVTGGTARLEWTGEGAQRVTLRAVCDPGAVAVTFTDPSLARS